MASNAPINIYLLSSNRANLCTFTVLFQIIQCHLSYRKVRFIGLLNDFTSKVILKIFFFKRPKKTPKSYPHYYLSSCKQKSSTTHHIFTPETCIIAFLKFSKFPCVCSSWKLRSIYSLITICIYDGWPHLSIQISFMARRFVLVLCTRFIISS